MLEVESGPAINKVAQHSEVGSRVKRRKGGSWGWKMGTSTCWRERTRGWSSEFWSGADIGVGIEGWRGGGGDSASGKGTRHRVMVEGW